jgi:hypothetical protein
VEDAVKAAYETGRMGSAEENLKIGRTLLKSGIDIEVPYTYDEVLMNAKLAEIAEVFDREAEDSKVEHKNGKFIITDEKDGLKMDLAAEWYESYGTVLRDLKVTGHYVVINTFEDFIENMR